MIYPEHSASLLTRAITPAVANAAGIESCSASTAAHDIYGADSPHSVPGDTIRIPYHTLTGDTMLGDDGVPYARHRIFDTRDPDEITKVRRYVARPGAGVRPFIPVGLRQLLETSTCGFVGITEGELKAISCVAHGIPMAAVSGVTMWSEQAGGGTLTEDSPVHEAILDLVKKARGAVILADSDAKDNPSVAKSMRLLAKAITRQTGLPAAYCCVPPLKVGKKTVKLGADDFIAQNPDEKKYALLELCTGFFQREVTKIKALASGGYAPLGTLGTQSIVWSVERGCIVSVTPGSITQPGVLMTLAGGLKWCEAVYGVPRSVDSVSVDWQKMGGELVERCLAQGPFVSETVRGAGVWRESDDLVVNDGDGVWRSSGEAMARQGGKFVYPTPGRMGIRPETPVATEQDGADVLECLHTWNWGSKSDPILMLGWIGLGYLTGALAWRPHISLTGPAGSGKSALQNVIKRLHGSAGKLIDGGSTEPGIRQHVKQNAMAIVVDESEADGAKLTSILTFFRSASDDKERLMGTQDQAGVVYAMRAIGMVAGVVPPQMNAADTTRFVRLNLTAVNAASVENPHRFATPESDAEEVGLRLWRRMISSWARFKAAQKLLRERLNGSSRYMDALAPILASTFVLLHDCEMTTALADELVSEVDLGEQSERMSEAKDEVDSFQHLMGCSLDLQIGSNRLKMTVAELCAHAIEELQIHPRGGEHQRALGQHGMRMAMSGEGSGVHCGTLLVASKMPGLKALFKGTKWEMADLGAVLRRAPGAERKVLDTTVSIGGQTTRPLAIHLPALDRPLAFAGHNNVAQFPARESALARVS